MAKKKQEVERPYDLQLVGEILVRAVTLIETPRSWTRRALARDRHSHPVSPTSKRAVRYCVGGALLRAAAERFDFEVKIAKAPDWSTVVHADDVIGAYRVLGEVMARLLLGEDVVEQNKDDWTKAIIRLRVGKGKREGEVVDEADWPAVVHTMNDHKTVSHAAVLLCLRGAIATLLAERLGDESFDIWRWIAALSKEPLAAHETDAPEERR